MSTKIKIDHSKETITEALGINDEEFDRKMLAFRKEVSEKGEDGFKGSEIAETLMNHFEYGDMLMFGTTLIIENTKLRGAMGEKTGSQ